VTAIVLTELTAEHSVFAPHLQEVTKLIRYCMNIKMVGSGVLNAANILRVVGNYLNNFDYTAQGTAHRAEHFAG
jgi:hypothetical protein